MTTKLVKAKRKKLIELYSQERLDEFRRQSAASVERNEYQDILATEDCFDNLERINTSLEEPYANISRVLKPDR